MPEITQRVYIKMTTPVTRNNGPDGPDGSYILTEAISVPAGTKFYIVTDDEKNDFDAKLLVFEQDLQVVQQPEGGGDGVDQDD